MFDYVHTREKMYNFVSLTHKVLCTVMVYHIINKV